MRKEYDFSNAKPNPYVKKQANALGMAYQNLIGLYLADCIATKKL
jgi:hypothetical protein